MSIQEVSVSYNASSYGINNESLKKWCLKTLSSYDYSLLLKATKWCTKRNNLDTLYKSNNGIKEVPQDFSVQEYKDLLGEKWVPKEEIDWLKDTNSASETSNKEQSKITEWCSAVKMFIFEDESDTEEYKRAIRYCVKKG